jgi:hypothetical protein
MFTLHRFRSVERAVVHDGRAACPRRGRDVDVDHCSTCAWLRGDETVDGVRLLKCHVDVHRWLPDFVPG